MSEPGDQFTVNQRLSNDELKAVLAGIGRGDESAFNQFYDAYYDRLFRFLMARLRCNEDLVHEVLQRVMLRVVKYIKPVESEGQIWNWLRLASRSAIAEISREHGSSLSCLGLDETEWLAIEQQDADEQPLRDALDSALTELAPNEYEMIDLAYFQRNTHADIAATAGCTAKAVEMRIARIRTKLKRLIGRIMGHE